MRVRLNPSLRKKFEALLKETDTPQPTELMNDALTLFKWAVEQRQRTTDWGL